MKKELKDRLSQHFGTSLTWKEESMTLTLELNQFLSEMKFLRFEAGFILLLDICGVDCLAMEQKPHARHRFELIYILLNMEEHCRLHVKLVVDEGCEIPSLSTLWESAYWCEREVWELLGLNIEKARGKPLFLSGRFEGHPLRKDFSINLKSESKIGPVPKREVPEKWLEALAVEAECPGEWVSLDPTHPAVADSMRVFLFLQGEKVHRAQCEVGFLHRGFEKLAEEKTYQQIIPYTERLNYNSPSINSIGWCMTVEKVAELEIPDRAKAIRMVLTEFSRISDHFLCLGSSAFDAGAVKDYYQCLELREGLFKAMESYSGARQMGNAPRIGGVAYDLPLGWITEALEVVKLLSSGVEKISLSLVQSRSWMEKTKSSTINASDAINWGLTGPALRACGVNYDLRKTNPYYFYQDVDFEIPLGISGDAYDRFLVRLEEIRQSLRIITQVLDNIPPGDVLIEDAVWCPSIADRRQREKPSRLSDYLPKVPRGEWYHFIEAANGELGFYLVSDGGSAPYRLKVRPPSLALCQSYSKLVEDSWYERALMTFSSLNIVPGEVDR